MSKDCKKRSTCELEIVVLKVEGEELVGEPVFRGLECDLPAWSMKHEEYREPAYAAIHSDTLEMVKRGEITLKMLKAQAEKRHQAEVLEYEAFVKALFEAGPFADPGDEEPSAAALPPRKVYLN